MKFFSGIKNDDELIDAAEAVMYLDRDQIVNDRSDEDDYNDMDTNNDANDNEEGENEDVSKATVYEWSGIPEIRSDQFGENDRCIWQMSLSIGHLISCRMKEIIPVSSLF